MARPAQEEADIIIVNCDGRILAWCAGALSGDEEMRRATEKATQLGLYVNVDQDTSILANHQLVENIPNVVAALFAYNPGRTFLERISIENRKALQNLDGLVEDVVIPNPDDPDDDLDDDEGKTED